MYNLTNLSNAMTVYEVTKYSNNITEGLFFTLGIVSIFVVLLFILKRYELPYAITSAGFICAMLSTVMYAGGMIPIKIALMFWGVTIIGVFYCYLVDRN